jgi:hypothetical protein
MTELMAPVVGAWYRHGDGRLFEIVAVDELDDTIETQYFDGTVEELDVEAWEALEPEPVEPPEDWCGAMDLEKEDYGVEYDESPHRHYANPLDFFDADGS